MESWKGASFEKDLIIISAKLSFFWLDVELL